MLSSDEIQNNIFEYNSMRVVIQRVSKASVSVDNQKISEIDQGLLIFLGITHLDNEVDVNWLCSKIVNLRIFEDDNKVMNRCVQDISAQVMVVSQFTLFASTKKGNRPSYLNAAPPDEANKLYLLFIETLQKLLNNKVVCGQFGADMQVSLINNGPVTILIDSKNKE
jgi:D-tyrosyl-tRNA(Tyr) deacylase